MEKPNEQAEDDVIDNIYEIASSVYNDNSGVLANSALKLIREIADRDQQSLQQVVGSGPRFIEGVLDMVQTVRDSNTPSLSDVDIARISRFNSRSKSSQKRFRDKMGLLVDFAKSGKTSDDGGLILAEMLLYTDKATQMDYTALMVEKALSAAKTVADVNLVRKLTDIKSKLRVNFNTISVQISEQVASFRRAVSLTNTYTFNKRDISSLISDDLRLTGVGHTQISDHSNLALILNSPTLHGDLNSVRPFIMLSNGDGLSGTPTPMVSPNTIRSFMKHIEDDEYSGVDGIVYEFFQTLNPGKDDLNGYLLTVFNAVMSEPVDDDNRILFLRILLDASQTSLKSFPMVLRDTLLSVGRMIDPNNLLSPVGGFVSYTSKLLLPDVIKIRLSENAFMLRRSTTNKPVVAQYVPRFSMTPCDEVGIQIARALVHSDENKLPLARHVVSIASNHYYGTEAVGWFRRLNSLFEQRLINYTRPAYLAAEERSDSYQVDSILRYFNYLGRTNFTEILNLIYDKDPSRWDEALASRVVFDDDIDSVPKHLQPLALMDSETGEYYVLKPNFPYNATNIKSGAGFPYNHEKKRDCLADVANSSAVIWGLVSNNNPFGVIHEKFPELLFTQPKPKKEVYELPKKVTVEGPLNTFALSDTAKCRTIFNMSFLAGYGAQKLFSLATNALEPFTTPYLIDDVLRYPHMEPPIFSIHGFGPAHGSVDLLLRRIQLQVPFNHLSSTFCGFGYSDNLYISGKLSSDSKFDHTSVQFADGSNLESDADGKVTLPAGTRVMISADGKRMETSTNRQFATRVLIAYLYTLGIKEKELDGSDSPTKTLFRYIVSTMLPGSCGCTAVIGSTAIEIPFSTSGHPLTFTYNDVKVFQILDHYSRNGPRDELGEVMVNVDELLSIAHKFAVTLTIERVVVLNPTGTPFTTNTMKVLNLDLLGFGVIALPGGPAMFTNTEVADDYLMVPVLEEDRMIKQFLYTKLGDSNDPQRDVALRCMRYISLLFVGGILDPFWTECCIPYLMENPEFIKYLSPEISEDYTIEDDLLLGVFKETYRASRSTMRDMFKEISDTRNQAILEDADVKSTLAPLKINLVKFIRERVINLYNYPNEDPRVLLPEEVDIPRRVVMEFALEDDGRVIRSKDYAFADKTVGSLAAFLDSKVQQFLHTYEIDGDFKLDGSNKVSKILFTKSSLDKMEQFFEENVKDRIKGKAHERSLPFFKDRVRKSVILQPSLLANGYLNYRKLIEEQRKIEAERRKEVIKQKEEELKLRQAAKVKYEQSVLADREARKAQNRQAVSESSRMMTLTEINRSVKVQMGESIHKLIGKELKSKTKLTSLEADKLAKDLKRAQQLTKVEKVSRDVVKQSLADQFRVFSSNSVSFFTEDTYDRTKKSLKKAILKTSNLNKQLTNIRNEAIQGFMKKYVENSKNFLENLLFIFKPLLDYQLKVEIGKIKQALDRLDGEASLTSLTRPEVKSWESFSGVAQSMIEALHSEYEMIVSEYEDYEREGSATQQVLQILSMIPPIKVMIFTDLIINNGEPEHIDGSTGPNLFEVIKPMSSQTPVVSQDYTFKKSRSGGDDEKFEYDINSLLNTRTFYPQTKFLNRSPGDKFDMEESITEEGSGVLTHFIKALYAAYAEQLILINRFEIPVQFIGSESSDMMSRDYAIKDSGSNPLSFDPRSLFEMNSKM